MEAALGASRPVVVAAVHGLCGVGKSTLAARYAAAQAQSGVVNPVWWITADNSEAVQAGLAALAVALQPELAEALSLEALAGRAVGWLAAHERWLLGLDDVTDPDDLTPLLGRTLTGRVLVTSRLAQGWHRLDARVIWLGVLSPQEVLELLARITGHQPPAAETELPTELDGAVELDAAPSEVQHALGELAAYNMINLDGETITVHRPVQAVARTPDPGDPHGSPTPSTAPATGPPTCSTMLFLARRGIRSAGRFGGRCCLTSLP